MILADDDDDDDDDEQGHGQEACLSDCDVKDCEGRGVDRGAKSGMLTGWTQAIPQIMLTGPKTVLFWTPNNTI